MTNPCCGLAVIFCSFISLLIGRETINIPEIFSGVHGFMGKTVKQNCLVYTKTSNENICSNLKIKFPDFLLTLSKDLEIPWPGAKLPDFSLTVATLLYEVDISKGPKDVCLIHV